MVDGDLLFAAGSVALTDDGSPDVFVHVKDAERSGIYELTEGQRYSFDVIEGRTGKPNAANLKSLG